MPEPTKTTKAAQIRLYVCAWPPSPLREDVLALLDAHAHERAAVRKLVWHAWKASGFLDDACDLVAALVNLEALIGEPKEAADA